MPKGNPNVQTKATDKYQKKAGYKAKTFKLKADITEKFKEACEKAGRSQASVIQEFMLEFIESQSE